jgi:hypothetical protein
VNDATQLTAARRTDAETPEVIPTQSAVACQKAAQHLEGGKEALADTIPAAYCLEGQPINREAVEEAAVEVAIGAARRSFTFDGAKQIFTGILCCKS